MNPDLAPGALRKPSRAGGRLDRYIAKRKKAGAKKRAKERATEAERAAWKAKRTQAYLRDHRRCRVFGTPLLLETDNLLKRAECHHVVYRSAGGSDELSNLATLSAKAHRMEHEGYLEISGDANQTLTIRQYEFKGGTREFVRSWESTVR